MSGRHKAMRQDAQAAPTNQSQTAEAATGAVERVCAWASGAFTTLILFAATVLFAGLSVSSAVLTVQGRDFSMTWATISTYNAIPVIVGLVLWCAVAVWVVRRQTVPGHRRIALIGFWISFLLSLAWIFISCSGPARDSYDVSGAAWAMLGDEIVPESMKSWAAHGRFVWGIEMPESMPSSESYLGRNPHQLLLVAMLELCQLVAGTGFAQLFQVLNAFVNGATWFVLIELAYELCRDDRAAVLALGICALFNPIVLYATFIYGNSLALLLDLLAWWLTLRALREGVSTRTQMLQLLGASALLALGALVKQTMVIVSIAFAVTMVAHMVRTRSVRIVPFVVLPFLLYSVTNGALLAHYEQKTGSQLIGQPKLTWIVMGLGGGREYDAAATGNPALADDLGYPGYFDAYVFKSPKQEGFASIDEMNAYTLKLRLQHFRHDPAFTLRFFGRKLATEWLEPTYECLRVSNYDGEPGNPATVLADKSREYTVVGRHFYYGRLNSAIICLADLAQSLVYFGALAYCAKALRNRRGAKLRTAELLPLILILGSVVLYVVWESKSMYLMPYIVFMIPQASVGWIWAAHAVRTHDISTHMH